MTRSLAGLLVGRTLADRYEIEALIGRGGMSLVYRATDRRLHRAVAVKVISLPSDSDQQHRILRERLRREAAAAAHVPPHPNVVQIYDYGTDAELDLDFIAMELLSGHDLKAILREGPLAHDEAIRILREAARGLSAGHRAGIIHRDVKPANIVVTSEPSSRTVKLLDFGIAKALETPLDDDLTRPGQSPHSPTYASPEQLRPGEPVTASSDVYQLGVVAREMLSRERPPYDNASTGDRWLAVPGTIREVIDRAMRPRPTDRYPDAAAFAEALSRAAESEDGTVAFAPEYHDETILAEPEPIPSTAASRHSPVGMGAAASPISRSEQPGEMAPRPGRNRPKRVLAWVTGVLVVVLAVRVLARGDGDDPLPPEPPFAAEIEALDEEFRDLVEEAYGNLQALESEEPEI